MKKVDINTSFSKYNDPELVLKAMLIFNSMTGNLNFATPEPTLAEVKAAADALDAAIVEAKEAATKTKILARENKREVLTGLLKRLSLYVKLTALDDAEVLASSGFSLGKTPEPVGVLAKPQNFTVEAVQVGTVKLSIKAINGANSYQYENRKKGTEAWDVLVDTKSKVTLTGLESGTLYEFRVTGIGTAAQRVYSDVLSSFVL
jgi:hypothetical protein